MTHTPGPWKYVPHDTLNGGTIIAPSQSADGLSEIVAHGRCNPNPADMSLIAAAPELLDTLQKCLDVFQSSDMPHSLRVGNGKQPTEDTILCLRMQIAKATGGE